jgi:hypothetical protein
MRRRLLLRPLPAPIAGGLLHPGVLGTCASVLPLCKPSARLTTTREQEGWRKHTYGE